MTLEGAEPRPAPRIGVVIPYFQRDAGLLRRALTSVAAQEHSPVQVVVVDDGSPRAAAEEITPTLHNALPGLTVIRQATRVSLLPGIELSMHSRPTCRRLPYWTAMTTGRLPICATRRPPYRAAPTFSSRIPGPKDRKSVGEG